MGWTPGEKCGAAKIEAIEKIMLVLKETLEQTKNAQTKTGKSTKFMGINSKWIRYQIKKTVSDSVSVHLSQLRYSNKKIDM